MTCTVKVEKMIKCGCDLHNNCFDCPYPSKVCDGDRKPKGYFCIDPVEQARLAWEKTPEGRRELWRKNYERQKREGYR